MLMCNETVTLVQMVREDDSEAFICTTIDGASWYGKAVTAVTTDGARIQNTYKARIPAGSMPDGVVPGKGDYLVRGIIQNVRRTPVDFDGAEYMLIQSVGDNRRGKLRHWAVSGA